jgi:hypothetical protein
MADAVFVTVVLVRFLLPLLIPKYPLPAVLGCLVVDAADQTIFQAFTDDPLPGYQSYDKALDVYYLAIAYISTMRNWRDPVAFQVSRFLYIYRLIGVTLFELLHWRWLLLVFPNTFEYVFIVYEAIRTRWNPLRLTALAVVGITAFIWIFVKLPQEWWIHIAKLDFTDFMSDHPYMWGVLAAVAAGAAIAIWVNRRKIPPADWPFTVDVDRHLPELPVLERQPGRFFDIVLLEKVVLLALLSVIFAQVLPDIRTGTLGIIVGIAVVVVLNAAISEWLYRRGHSWNTTFSQFGAMLLVNLAIVFVDSLFFSRGDEGDAPATNTLFFVVLLAMLIAFFDRYRGTRPRELDHEPQVIAKTRAEWSARRAAHAA